jgi:hypothetical protein
MQRLLSCLVVFFILSCRHGGDHGSELAADSVAVLPPPAVHGMVIFGDDLQFASHIPMFGIPHDWQALFEVKISSPKPELLADIKKKMSPRQQLYTVRPKPFVLPDLLSGKLSGFSADLFQGNFEDGGKLIASNVTVRVQSVLTSTHLDKRTAPADHLGYIMVQNGSKAYLAHRIVAPKSFDHLVEASLLKPVQLGSRILNFRDLKDLDRLPSGLYSISATGDVTSTLDRAEASLEVTHSFYCTLGPDFFETCAD